MKSLKVYGLLEWSVRISQVLELHFNSSDYLADRVIDTDHTPANFGDLEIEPRRFYYKFLANAISSVRTHSDTVPGT